MLPLGLALFDADGEADFEPLGEPLAVELGLADLLKLGEAEGLADFVLEGDPLGLADSVCEGDADGEPDLEKLGLADTV